MRLRYFSLLLVGGMAIGAAFPHRLTAAFGQTTLYVFLPALIFEAAWHLDLRLVRRNWSPIALLSVPGVLLTAGIVAAGAHYACKMPWTTALLLGTILSATDPVAVVAVFRRLPIPRGLATIVESESLFNDAAAVVLYRAVLGYALLGAGAASLASTVWQTIAGVALGALIGVAMAYIAASALRERVGVGAQSLATFAGSYASYVVTDHLHGSGIVAVLTFGLALRRLEQRRITVQVARGVEGVWDWTATIANVCLFFMIGAAIDFRSLQGAAPIAGVTLGMVLAARAALAYGLLRFVRPRLDAAWIAAIRMAAMRGALSLALAIATPAAIPQRGALIDATFAVVIVTLLAGTLTLDWRLGRLRLSLSTRGP